MTTKNTSIDLTTFRVIHRALVRDARLLALVSAGWLDGPSPTAAQLRAVADHFDHYFALLHHHHEGEDEIIWPAVVESGGGEQATLDALTADHRLLDPLLARLPGSLHELADRPTDRGLTAELARDTAQLADLLERHIDTEERNLFPVISASVTAARWRAVEKRLKRSLHPRHVGFMAAWIASAAGPDEARRLPLRPIARVARRRYEWRAAVAFATPLVGSAS